MLLLLLPIVVPSSGLCPFPPRSAGALLLCHDADGYGDRDHPAGDAQREKGSERKVDI